MAGTETGARPRAALPRMIAHRGASRAAPENTLAAIEAAARQGAGAVEIDMSLLGDGTPVVFHDPTLERTGGGTGPLSAIGAGDLAALDAGAWFGRGFAGEPVPTLEAALDRVAALDLALNLELKPHDGPPGAVAEAAARALGARAWARSRVVVSSFSEAALAALRALAPAQPLAMLWGAPPRHWPETLAALGAEALHIDWREANPAVAAGAREAGVALRVYTANDPAALLPMREGLDGVITDHPPLYFEDPAWGPWARAVT